MRERVFEEDEDQLIDIYDVPVGTASFVLAYVVKNYEQNPYYTFHFSIQYVK